MAIGRFHGERTKIAVLCAFRRTGLPSESARATRGVGDSSGFRRPARALIADRLDGDCGADEQYVTAPRRYADALQRPTTVSATLSESMSASTDATFDLGRKSVPSRISR
jgi:hypothetical protein